MLQKLLGIASPVILATITIPEYLALPYVYSSLFFFGEPEYPSDTE